MMTGGSGLLALNWTFFAKDKCKVILALNKKNVSLQGVQTTFINLQSKDDILANLKRYKPDALIHTAGLTNVDECERNPSLAKHINGELPLNVALACKDAGVKLVHISTDHLFSGEKPLLSEDSLPQPINVYAKSKLEGEQAVQSVDEQALIIRTNFFGWGYNSRESFSDWIHNSLSNNKQITLFDDVYFTPILIDTLARCIHILLEYKAAGVFNVVTDNRISKFEFGLMLCKQFGFDNNLIHRGSISNISGSAPRPNDMSLSNHKLKQQIGLEKLSLTTDLEELKVQLKAGRYDKMKFAILEN